MLTDSGIMHFKRKIQPIVPLKCSKVNPAFINGNPGHFHYDTPLKDNICKINQYI